VPHPLSALHHACQLVKRGETTQTDTGETLLVTANFLWVCLGYYQNSEGYTPEWLGMDRFKGPIIHP
jgi:cation diffusion facilitator CzcD-associated flavoprotein CzcO